MKINDLPKIENMIPYVATTSVIRQNMYDIIFLSMVLVLN